MCFCFAWRKGEVGMKGHGEVVMELMSEEEETNED